MRSPLLEEIDRLLAVNRNFNSQLLAVTMAMHARLGAESGLKALDDSLLKLIFDQFFRASKTSSLLDNRDFNNEGEESLCSRTWAYSDSSEGEDDEFWVWSEGGLLKIFETSGSGRGRR